LFMNGTPRGKPSPEKETWAHIVREPPQPIKPQVRGLVEGPNAQKDDRGGKGEGRGLVIKGI